jgi:protein required for attachment to host cells
VKPDCFLIANASQARLLQREPGCPLVVLQAFHHPESRLRSSELGNARSGFEMASQGYGGVAFEPRADAHRKEHLRFARELAAYLERAAADGRFRSLAILASSPFLGELRQQLGSATQRILSGIHDVDLTSVGLAELEPRIRDELKLPR